MSNNDEKKSIFNMPGNELEAMIKRLSRYTLAVEFVSIAACVPMITKSFFLLLVVSCALMLIGCLAMQFCSERKTRRWKVIAGVQLVIALLDAACIASVYMIGSNPSLTVMTVITYVFLWIHNILCFIEVREAESLLFMRHVGVFIIIVTLIVCYMAARTLHNLGIDL